ncbi:MAG: Extracellular ligand-binding receptor, partial [Chloroflexi bacterium]|nr:Extracellular ligand-binding receptor [Chloroflexota bacterium]
AAPPPATSSPAPPPGSPAPAAIKIGVMTSVTGPDASSGGPSQFAYQLAIDDINKAGGVFVKAYNKKIPLAMDLRDNQTDPEKVMASAEQINADGCPVAVGTTLGGIAASLFEKNKLPFVVGQQSIVALTKAGFKYYFNIDKLNSGQSAGIFAMTASLPKGSVPTKWAFLEEQADWVIELAGIMKQDAAKQGITFSYEGQYQMLAPDMSQLLIGAKNSGAEVIVGAPTTPDAITLLKQMLQLNYHPKAIIFFRAGDDPSWGDLGPLGNYVIGSPQWTAGLMYKDPGVQALVAAWKAKSGKDGGNPCLGPSYASIQLVAAAIEKAGSLDRSAIRDAIASIDVKTVIGQIKLDPTGVRIDAPLTVEQWQNGVMQLVWPVGPDNDTKPVIWPIPQQ